MGSTEGSTRGELLVLLLINSCDQYWRRETNIGGVRDSDRRLVAYHIYFHGHPKQALPELTVSLLDDIHRVDVYSAIAKME